MVGCNNLLYLKDMKRRRRVLPTFKIFCVLMLNVKYVDFDKCSKGTAIPACHEHTLRAFPSLVLHQQQAVLWSGPFLVTFTRMALARRIGMKRQFCGWISAFSGLTGKSSFCWKLKVANLRVEAALKGWIPSRSPSSEHCVWRTLSHISCFSVVLPAWFWSGWVWCCLSRRSQELW